MYTDISTQAQTQANTFKNSLQYLVDAQNQQKILDQQTAAQKYQNLLNQINQQRQPIQQQFASDSQSAYINKMLAGKQINQNLNQLGLNTQGFGISQQAANETAYGQNLNTLMLNRNQSIQNIDNQVTNAAGDYATEQASLDATYASRLNDLNKYIEEQTQTKYNTIYSQLSEAKKYEDQLKQLAWENDYKNRALKASSNSGGGSNNPWGNDHKPKPVDPNTVTVSSNYLPKLSNTTASKWVNSNISSVVIKNKGITVGNLKKLLTNAYEKKILNDKDVAAVLKSFGLE